MHSGLSSVLYIDVFDLFLFRSNPGPKSARSSSAASSTRPPTPIGRPLSDIPKVKLNQKSRTASEDLEAVRLFSFYEYGRFGSSFKERLLNNPSSAKNTEGYTSSLLCG